MAAHWFIVQYAEIAGPNFVIIYRSNQCSPVACHWIEACGSLRLGSSKVMDTCSLAVPLTLSVGMNIC